MPKIFISYRREESEAISGRIYDRLAGRYGKEAVFMDVDNIPLGVDFVEHLARAVGQCDILLAIIGEQWLDVAHKEGPRQGQRRLDDPNDFVRIEIETALLRNIPVIPILVGKASMPDGERLPTELKRISTRNAAEIRSGRDFHDHVDRLIRGIEYLIDRSRNGDERDTNEAKQKRNQQEGAIPLRKAPFQKDGESKTEEQQGPCKTPVGETRLILFFHDAIKRGQGELTDADNDVAKLIKKQGRIRTVRANQILDEAMAQWQKARSLKQERRPGEIIENSIGMKFAWIPPGLFLMGSSKKEEKRSNDEFQHLVMLKKGLHVGIHLVTQEQWQTVMGANPSRFKGEPNLPVEQVSWEDCQEFVEKLREKDEKPYRLPFEAEWEYACRAGTTAPFCFGETISTDQANYDGNFTYGNGKKGCFRQKTTPVGSFPANAIGLFDMHGNVWEWCQDWYGEYPKHDRADPHGPEKGEGRVLRGGSWYTSPLCCRSASRFKFTPGKCSKDIGFRLCFCVD